MTVQLQASRPTTTVRYTMSAPTVCGRRSASLIWNMMIRTTATTQAGRDSGEDADEDKDEDADEDEDEDADEDEDQVLKRDFQ